MLLVALGLAIGTAILGIALGGTAIAQDRRTARTLERLPPASRAVHVAYFGVPGVGDDVSALGPVVRRALAPLKLRPPVHVVQYRIIEIAGARVQLGAVDGLARSIRLRSGRLPKQCRPSRCEVVQIEGSGAIPTAPGIRLVRVGTGELTSDSLFGRFRGPEALHLGESLRLQKPPPFLLARSTRELTALPALSSFFRSYGWVVPLAAGDVAAWDVEEFLATVARSRSALAVKSVKFELTAPERALRDAATTGRVAARRLQLAGGQLAALLVAFAVIAGASMREDVRAAWRRLTWFGARRWQRALVAATESAVVVAAGAFVGWLLAAAAVVVVATEAGSSPAAVLRHSLLSRAGVAVVLGAATAAAVALLATVATPRLQLGRRSLSALDALALAALVALTVAVSRGDIDPAGLADREGAATLLLLTPGLVILLATVTSARLLAPALRLLERAVRSGALAPRLAALSIARQPGRATLAVTFVVASVALALFAAIYRATLSDGLDDQVGYEFPADFILRERPESHGVSARLAATRDARDRIGASVVPVIRREASVSAIGPLRRLTVLGIPASRIEELEGWRNDFSDLTAHEIAQRLETTGSGLRGVPIPASTTRLAVRATVTGDAVSLRLNVLTPRGDFATLDLGTARRGTHVLAADVPARARGGRIVAITLARASLAEGHLQGRKPVFSGVLTLGAVAGFGPRIARPLMATYAGWLGVDGVEPLRLGESATVRYLVQSAANSRFRVAQASDEHGLPVIVSPGLAPLAGGGSLAIRLGGERLMASVVGTARHFPSLHGDFVLADERSLFVAVNAERPGAALPNELWISAHSHGAEARLAAALERPRFGGFEIAARADFERQLLRDPLARAALLALAGAGLAALALALIGLSVLLRADIRDETGELFDLEVEGAEPPALRRHVRLRALLVTAAGLVAGTATGLALAAFVVDFVAVTAIASAPDPPLVLSVDWPLVSAMLVAYGALVALLVFAVTVTAFRLALERVVTSR